MKTLSCKVKNSTDTVMGKITFKRHFLGKKNYIFVTDKTVSASNYAAIISSSLTILELIVLHTNAMIYPNFLKVM